MASMRDATVPAWRADPLDILVDPVVRAASRLLARLHFPLFDLDDLPEGEAADLLRRHLPPHELPLDSLRDALDQLGSSLEMPSQPPLVDSPSAPLVSDPGLLEGIDPASRAARVVYRTLLADPDLRRLGPRRAERVAFLRAYDFRALCAASLPVDAFSGPEGRAALHAWAQSYAREYLHSSRTLGPSARCALAARLASTMVARLHLDADDG